MWWTMLHLNNIQQLWSEWKQTTLKFQRYHLSTMRLLQNRFPKMDAVTIERLKKKFGVCYLLAKENVAFLKYPAVLEVREHRGVAVGFAYRTKNSAKLFTHYMAES